MATATISELVEACTAKIAEACEQAQHGPDRLVKVVLATDGEPYVSESVSRERGEDEYFGRVPHARTVWEMQTRQLRVEDGDDEIDYQEFAEGQVEEVERRVREWCEAGNFAAAE